MIEEFVYLAFRNIRHRKKRTALTIIGIFVGIMAVVSLVSLGQGLQDSIESQFEQIGSDKVFINPGGSFQFGSGDSLTEDDLQAVRNVQGIDEAAGVIFSSTSATYQDDQSFVSLLGTPTGEGYEVVKSSWAIQIGEGRDLRSTDMSNVVIGSQVAESVFGEELDIRSRIDIQGETYQVVGIMQPTGDPSIDRSVLVTRESARSITDREEGSYDWIFASTDSGFTPSDVTPDIEEALRDSRNVDEGEEDFTVSTQEQLVESFNNILNVVRGVVIGIASISLVVGAVNIMNTMYTSVTERTREIGLMKAIGATKRQILALFLIESALIGFVGGMIGMLTGIGLSALASYFATQATGIAISPYLSPVLIIGSVLFSTFLGVAAGVLPARQASDLPPAEALRYE